MATVSVTSDLSVLSCPEVGADVSDVAESDVSAAVSPSVFAAVAAVPLPDELPHPASDAAYIIFFVHYINEVR